MKIDPSAINSPLAMIALFVAIIELFLIFPVSKLTGRDRTLLVIFIVAYPIFIAGSFFVFLWNKPVNLYTPQTLSENLQKALLPAGFDTQLAPDRATLEVVKLKVTQLELQLRDISHKMESNAGLVAPPDVAKLSDLEKLKVELLKRAEATGDVSRTGLATAAKEIQTEKQKSLAERAAAARNELVKFKLWLQPKGLTVSAPDLKIKADFETSLPAALNKDTVTLGSAATDYVVPAYYIKAIAESKGVKSDVADDERMFTFVWTISDYMATKFSNATFPNPNGPYSVVKGNSTGRLVWSPIIGSLSISC